ncbi:hypothetical protein L2E82_09024 [Cichorium intybus]|uniref:Uncharacterized protein n=1 Tax=Cichorium intybus TaxID=13427 RepID=A0ACB9G7Y7_CICIN|nr:hypothetical protein L2E82_09024 [Cichorium intybus]
MSEDSVNSPSPPPTPIPESFRKFSLNMNKLTGLNYVDWICQWRLVMRYVDKEYIVDFPLPSLPKHGVTQQLINHHNLLIDEDEDVRLLMLLTIDRAIRRDFEFLGPHELIQLVEERFQEPVRQEKLRICKRLGKTRLRKGHNVSAHTLKIEGYLGYKLGHPLSQEANVNGLLASLTEEYEPFIQIYRQRDLHKTFMEMHTMLTLYESLVEMHSSGLSPALKQIKNPSRRILRCHKLGIHRVGYRHRIIRKRSKAK